MQPTASAAMATRPSSSVARNCAEALAPRAEQVGLGDPAVVEGQRVGVTGVPAELVVGRLGGEARRAGRHDDRRDLGLRHPGGRARRNAGLRGDRDDGRDVRPGVGDELLAAVDDPLAVDEVRLGLRGAGVRTRARLGETEAGEGLSGDQVGKPGLLLLLGAERQDRVDAETDGCFERDAHRLVDATDLLDRHTQAGEVAVLARTPELFRRGEAEQPELAHLLHGVDGEVVVLVPLRGVRRDLGLRELAHALPERLVLSSQLERCHGGPHFLVRGRACLTLTST